ncbi:3-oxoacyl-[acyl-carrier-protein] synthase 3 [Desulfuromonas versatilis]|uniref:Beta-ketoacyl-[acyl-carrier-protein] synthase III n=1 Tax=Desulfuromonas versatilis TaxID=2802975 RepID=A0ABM8HX72_9BACT|nr:beta-ketoacyl-ACP synthase III [Desulfuromonas versatilis]BCR06941.1 3-oxoacyl-[acyl-carrier-protein] synthase 3 [Desulfuromonas versatilis]
MTKKPQVMVLGSGRAVPEKVLTNADLEKMVDTTDQWILSRTGIRERRIVEPGVGLSELATAAAQRALADAGVAAEEIDLIIVGTVTGDMKFPATACLVQDRLGARRATAFDLSAACSGFLYSLQVAQGLMTTAGYRRALVIGGDVLTSMVNWEDRDTCVLFGDGAGAVVLGPSDGERGLLHCYLRSDGAYSGLLYNPGCGSLNPPTPENVRERLNSIVMNGREVFRHAVTSMTEALTRVLEEAGIAAGDIDLLIPHQANLRIIEAVSKRFDMPQERVYVNVERYGNTSAASIPIAFDEARRSGVLQPGNLVAMVTFGGGFTWAAGLMRC